MRKRTKSMLACLAVALMFAVTGCGGAGSSSSESTAATAGSSANKEIQAEEVVIPAGESVSREKDIVAAANVDFTTLDPMDTSDTLSGGVQRMIMDGLFGFDDDMKLVPMLATGYEANEDATEFTITLRQGITFSDGEAFNADAVIANVEKWMDKELGLKRTTFLCNTIESVEKIDDYTVKIYLVEPFGAFVNSLAHPACLIMSPKQIAQGPEVCAEQPIGTGQYTFVEWVPGEHLTVALNENWWGFDASLCDDGVALAESDAGFKTVTFKPVTENATRVAMLQSGEAQVVWPVPAESRSVLAADTNLRVNAEAGLAVYYFMMNNQKEPFNDVRVRQAINYAINKEAFIQIVQNGMGDVATSMIGKQTQYYKENTPYEYNVEKAKELLAEAGYPDGFTTSLIYANTSANQKAAEFFKQQLAEVGITLELNGMESALVNQTVQGANTSGAEAEVECYIIGWSSSTGDADWALRPLFAKESEPPMSYNISYYENDTVDELLYAALQTADTTARSEAYAEVQDILWEECPVIPVYNSYNTMATSSKISGVKLYPDNALNMKNARMAE